MKLFAINIIMGFALFAATGLSSADESQSSLGLDPATAKNLQNLSVKAPKPDESMANFLVAFGKMMESKMGVAVRIDFGCEDAPQVAWFFSQKARSILGIDLDNDPKNPFAAFGNVEKCLTALDVMKALVSRLPPSIINRDSKALVVRFRH